MELGKALAEACYARTEKRATSVGRFWHKHRLVTSGNSAILRAATTASNILARVPEIKPFW
jgi:hypothetical protein